jgi:alpha-D-ribose 1-methylphosphonate 5-triphosphate synthase subunit PhnH
MNTEIDLPGFADPVVGAQASFRAVLEAMARPGSLHRAGDGLTPPAPLDPATAAVLLTLIDAETAVWLDPAAEAARGWLAFHCGVEFAAAPERAEFALALGLPPLATLNPGTHEGPETSATLILQVAALDQGAAYRLSGPGLRVPATLRVQGLGDGFLGWWRENAAIYPRGIDLMLCAGTMLAALPRSVRIEEG